MGRRCSRPSLAFADGWGRGREPSRAGDYLRRHPRRGTPCAVDQGGTLSLAAPRRWPGGGLGQGCVSPVAALHAQVGTPVPVADSVTPTEVRLHLCSHPCSGL